MAAALTHKALKAINFDDFRPACVLRFRSRQGCGLRMRKSRVIYRTPRTTPWKQNAST
jgi:hypothetical protein